MDISFLIILLTGILVGAAAGYLGSLMVLRRMSLVGDAFSHVALPGIGLAIVFKANPFIGAFLALFLGVFLIWSIQYKTRLPVETVVGIIFAASLALGAFIIPEPELAEALFGDIAKVTLNELILTLALSAVIFFVGQKIFWPLILETISEDLARSKGINTTKHNLIYLLLVGIVVALGIKVAGALLMGSLVIIPAASAKNISKNLKTYVLNAMIFGVLSALLGIFSGQFFGVSPGPAIIVASAVIFSLTLLFKR